MASGVEWKTHDCSAECTRAAGQESIAITSSLVPVLWDVAPVCPGSWKDVVRWRCTFFPKTVCSFEGQKWKQEGNALPLPPALSSTAREQCVASCVPYLSRDSSRLRALTLQNHEPFARAHAASVVEFCNSSSRRSLVRTIKCPGGQLWCEHLTAAS